LIIVEGPDGSGKSMLAKQLSSMLDIPVAEKAVDPEMRAMVDVPSYITRALDHPLIYDRFALISGPIYGALGSMRPPNDIFKDSARFDDWLRAFRNIRPRIIYCLPPLELVKDNVFNVAPQPPEVRKLWEQAYWSYWVKAHQDEADSAVSSMIFDYTRMTPHKAANWLAPRRTSDG
jgi:hypothetical protein